MSNIRTKSRDSLSRRKFLQTLGLIPALPIWEWASMPVWSSEARPGSNNSGPDFEEVPPSVSGINRTHVNGRSPMAHLPETVGAGCAFLDYDNDGWMDIYLVNSGPCDFYQPAQPLRNALYRNDRDGTFTDVTQKAGVPGD